MHTGGKLAFRSRLQGGEDDPGDRLLIGGDDPPHLRELVPPGCRGVEIEIGCGKGLFLVAAATKKPHTFLLGIEAATGYASLAATKLHQGGAANAMVLVDNGKLYLTDRVATGQLDALHVYFPDPWPKRRHQGRRFFTNDVPPGLARVIRPGGFCYVATDNAAYAGQIARVLGGSPDFVRDEAEERKARDEGPGYAFSPTNFERKYVEQGRTFRRYAFRRVSA